jgi:NAD-dependent protein deacetylase/lipoamidase
MEALAELIRDRQPCVVLTGAGVSTESGIPDFRSPSGLWATFDPLEYGSIQAFRADPLKVWSFYKPRVAMLSEAEPNPAHVALAELERLGYVQAVVTQNIDLLHERAGSEEVVEVHGSIRTATCPRCGACHPLAQVLELLAAADAPACEACGAILKPDVVFFGELLSTEAIERAYELARRRLRARGLSDRRAAGGDARRRRRRRDRQPGADAVRRKGGAASGGERGRGPARGRQAAARLTGRSSSTRLHSEQTVRSTSYGTPSRWSSRYVRTPVCR